jgi:putative FmdB family regulatory protein
MPTYEYACKDCGERLEVVQSFQDDPLTVCPACEGRLRKIFSAAGIVFKGSGWHIKDYGTSAARSSGEGTSTGEGSSTSEKKEPAGAGSTSDSASSSGGESEKKTA